ncbi:MAG: AAA family ATPase [Catenulispora sp.]|nr:AAA family ATPase [Catenulispora sp.]
MSVAAPPGPPANNPAIPFLKTRLPTGKPPWPLVLLAGVHKCGKSYTAAEFSGSDMVGRTFWIEIGEGDANHYGEVPGAHYEIVDHDGSYKGIMYAAWAATKQLRYDDRPNAIVVDNVTQLWEMLTAEIQAIANRRRKDPDSEATITMDLWNVAKKRWGDFIDVLRQHDGPVLLIARMEHTTIVDANGNPTKDKDWKIRTEKNLPFEVDVVITMPDYRTFEVSGVRSLRLQIPRGEKRLIPDFTTHDLMQRLGLDAAGATEPRIYVAPRPDPADAFALTAAESTSQGGHGPTEPSGPRASAEQVREILDLLDRVGPADGPSRLQLVSGILGTAVSGPRDLDPQQAQTVINALRAPGSGEAEPLEQADEASEPTEGAEQVENGPEPSALLVIPALEQVAVEPPRSRPGVEDFGKSLADAKHLEAVDRVEARFIRDFHATAINNALFVDLAIAVAERRAELGAPPPVNPAAGALTAILSRAASKRNSLQDVGRIHALIHQHAASGKLPQAEATELLEQCKAVYQAVATRTEASEPQAA